MIGETVNGTEAVWLNSMQDQGASVAIDGMALSNDAVANLMSNLQKTGYFRNIEIKESIQDESGQRYAGVSIHADLRKGEVVKADAMNFGELTGLKLLGVLVLAVSSAPRGLYYTVFKSATRRKCGGPDQAPGEGARERGTGSLSAQAGRYRAPARQPEAATRDRAQASCPMRRKSTTSCAW